MIPTLAAIVRPSDGSLVNAAISQPDFADLGAAQRSFSRLSASTTLRSNVTSSTTTESMTVEAVDGAYFPTFGAGAALGRVITDRF